jgi:formate dehydrogenase subunit gamma
MTSAVERFDERARRPINARGRTVVHPGEIVRHPVYTRVLHWAVAIFFVPALLSGLAIYSPWFYRALTPLFGGGPMTRLLHPWFSIGFVIFFTLQFLNWLRPMTWNADDRRWLSRIRAYATNTEPREPEYVDFFNAGQKLYFWAIVISSIIFVLSGFPMWFPRTFGRITVDIGYVLHDIAALVMLGGFIVHIYESTAAVQGTLDGMTRGTVERRWARTHHPRWYRRVTGEPRREPSPPARADDR